MKKKFNWRSFISFGLFYFFFVLLFSGVILYITPPGRIANWTNWQLFGLTKAQWQTMHTNFAYLFAILSIFHLFTINWKTFWTYVRSKIRSGVNRQRELVLATLLSILFFVAAVYDLPPLSTVMEIGENFKNSWEEEYDSPPVPHAEEYTITELSEEILDIPEATLLARLNELGIEVQSNEQNLKELSSQVDLSPQAIYHELAGSTGRGTGGIKPGGGMGRKSLRQLAEENNMPLEEMLSKLESAGIQAAGEDVMRDLATRYNLQPSEILTILNDNSVN